MSDRFHATRSSQQALDQARLFPDPPDRVRVTYNAQEGCHEALCGSCGRRLVTSHDKARALTSGQESLGKHRCASPGDLPKEF